MRDLYDTKNRYARALNNLAESRISAPDKKRILKYVNYRVADGMGMHRAIKYIRILRTLAEQLDTPIMKATKDDIIPVTSWVHLTKNADETKRDYLIILRAFFRYLDKPQLVDWITIKPPKRKIPTILTEEEILAMIEAATNTRDQAIIAGLYESSTRAGEYFASLKIGNVAFDQYGATLTVDGKTGMRQVRVVFSAPYIKNWIRNHPFRNNPNEYVWIGIGTVGRDKPLNYPAIARVINRISKRAGIRKKISLKTFRHTRATLLSNHLTGAQLNDYQGWNQGSEMPDTYIHLNGGSTEASILRMYGIDVAPVIPLLHPVFCPECGELNAPTFFFCLECRAILQHSHITELNIGHPVQSSSLF